MTVDSPYPLETLERRWQTEKTPQLGLQLAEEHRRRGSLDQAVEVLEDGLEANPDHQASRVALSRYLVDAERFEEAIAHLEQIVRVDPAHLVANKLLVRAYTGVGRLEDAGEKLDIYEMLGEGDADIEGLRAALGRGAEPAPPIEANEPEAVDTAETQELLPAETLSVEEAISSEVAPTEVSPKEVSGLPGWIEPAAQAGLGEADEAEVAEVAAVLESEPESESDSEPESAAEAEEPFGWTASEPSTYWEDLNEEGIFAVGPPPEPAASDTDSVSGATATLGNLYLEQGHSEQAAQTFEEVLDRDPDNARARQGLEAASESAVETPADEPGLSTSSSSPVERKRAALVSYLERIRRGAEAGY